MRQRLVSAEYGIAGVANPRLHERVSDAVSVFSCCLDAAITQPTKTTIDDLRDATNCLMRAGARVLIELERSVDSAR